MVSAPNRYTVHTVYRLFEVDGPKSYSSTCIKQLCISSSILLNFQVLYSASRPVLSLCAYVLIFTLCTLLGCDRIDCENLAAYKVKDRAIKDLRVRVRVRVRQAGCEV